MPVINYNASTLFVKEYLSIKDLIFSAKDFIDTNIKFFSSCVFIYYSHLLPQSSRKVIIKNTQAENAANETSL